MKEIILVNNNGIALVDDQDHERLITYPWYLSKGRNTNYATIGMPSMLRMHEMIIGKTTGFWIDHEDGNGLNNQRHNLRLATPSQNAANGRKRVGESGYRGVYREPSTGKWFAQISVNCKSKRIGTFDTKEQAAVAYDTEAQARFGQFARLNFPPTTSIIASTPATT